MELSDLYSEMILSIVANAPAMPRLAAPQGSARKVSRVCGSAITVDLALRNGVVSAFGQDVQACALGQTSAAVMARNIIGTTPMELRQLREQMTAMLKTGGPPPDGRWSELRYLEPVREYPQRHGSTLLVFDAVVAALDAIEAMDSTAVAS